MKTGFIITHGSMYGKLIGFLKKDDPKNEWGRSEFRGDYTIYPNEAEAEKDILEALSLLKDTSVYIQKIYYL